MSAPLPDALGARFHRYIEEGLSGRAAALRLKLSPATGARWALAIRRTGQARAAPQGRPKGRGKLDPHRAFFAEVIGQDADITTSELATALLAATGMQAHPNAIGKFLRKLGYTHKKRHGSLPNVCGPGDDVAAPVGRTVVILDNLAPHKNAQAAKAMRDAGCWFLFLPPYSPDLNPVEMAFPKLKAHIRRIGARSFTDMFDAIAEVCDLYSPQECWNDFKAAGYAPG